MQDVTRVAGHGSISTVQAVPRRVCPYQGWRCRMCPWSKVNVVRWGRSTRSHGRRKIKTLKTFNRLSVDSVIRGPAPLAKPSANRKRERSEDRGLADNRDNTVKKWKV